MGRLRLLAAKLAQERLANEAVLAMELTGVPEACGTGIAWDNHRTRYGRSRAGRPVGSAHDGKIVPDHLGRGLANFARVALMGSGMGSRAERDDTAVAASSGTTAVASTAGSAAETLERGWRSKDRSLAPARLVRPAATQNLVAADHRGQFGRNKERAPPGTIHELRPRTARTKFRSTTARSTSP